MAENSGNDIYWITGPRRREESVAREKRQAKEWTKRQRGRERKEKRGGEGGGRGGGN